MDSGMLTKMGSTERALVLVGALGLPHARMFAIADRGGVAAASAASEKTGSKISITEREKGCVRTWRAFVKKRNVTCCMPAHWVDEGSFNDDES